MPGTSLTLASCPRCGRPTAVSEVACPSCGERRREAAPPLLSTRPALATDSREDSLDGRWIVLGVGVFFAPVLTLTPLLRYMGWFLASLVHEMGHSAVAWAFGCPAFPAIRLDGHAAAFHRDQQPLICVLVVAGLLAFAWSSRARPVRLAIAVAVLAAYPLTAFTKVHEALFLLAGHLGELAFAAYAFSRATDGGFSGTMAERCAHSAVGWYLIGRVGVLAIGLVTSDAARATYAENGSFGLENDLVRFARDVLGTSSLAPGAILLLAIALGIAGNAVLQAALGAREESDSR